MPFTLTVLAIAIAASYARGGRLTRIAEADLRTPTLLFAGLALQLGVDVAAGRGWLAAATTESWLLLLLSQVLVVAWLVRNRHLPGVPLVALGLLMNAAVIAANGAMPVDPRAIEALGLAALEVPLGKHTLLTESSRLPWLADIWAIRPLRSIISPGDVVLAVGLLPLTHELMTWRHGEPRPERGFRPARAR